MEQVKTTLNGHDRHVRLQTLLHMQFVGRKEGLKICQVHLDDQEPAIKKQAEHCITYRNHHKQ